MGIQVYPTRQSIESILTSPRGLREKEEKTTSMDKINKSKPLFLFDS
jgi:hypothetical protein